MVETFYNKVNQDELLSPVFNDFSKINWEEHLPKMYAFWGRILLGIGEYHGQPLYAHLDLPIKKEHFERWLLLFYNTINENFIGNVAEEAKHRANNIATVFQMKMKLIL